MSEAQRTVIFGSAAGLHARPASSIAQAVAASGHTVTLQRDGGSPVNAGSVLLLLTTGTQHGDTLTLTVTGADADAVADALATLISADLDTADGPTLPAAPEPD